MASGELDVVPLGTYVPPAEVGELGKDPDLARLGRRVDNRDERLVAFVVDLARQK
jgi:hypothetical protein